MSCDQESPTLRPLTQQLVEIIHVNSPTDFYVIPKDKVPAFESFVSRLTSVSAFGVDLYRYGDPNERVKTAMLYRLEEFGALLWKRVKILELLPDQMCKILFIDFGGEEVVPMKELRRLPTCFDRIPPFAIHCSMDIRPKGHKWGTKRAYALKRRSHGLAFKRDKDPQPTDPYTAYSGEIRANCICVQNGISIVELYCDGSTEGLGSHWVKKRLVRPRVPIGKLIDI